jgi:hypothetical protein
MVFFHLASLSTKNDDLRLSAPEWHKPASAMALPNVVTTNYQRGLNNRIPTPRCSMCGLAKPRKHFVALKMDP